MKTITFIAAADGQDRRAFRQRLLEEFPSILRRSSARHGTVNLVDQGESESQVDAVVELWGDAMDGLERRLEPELGARCIGAYRITERIVKDDLHPAGQAAQGVKLIAPWVRRDELSPAAARRRWNEHAPLATRVHVGAARYVQNWVDARTAASPNYQGIAFLHFPTIEDFQQRLFDRPESVQLIQDDVDAFIARNEVLLTSEYVFDRSSKPLAVLAQQES